MTTLAPPPGGPGAPTAPGGPDVPKGAGGDDLRWEAPPPVADPRLNLRELALRIHRVVGLSPAGWVALAAALVTLVGFLTLHWVELLYITVMLFGLVVVALLFTLGRPRYDVTLELRDQRVIVGEDAAGHLGVRNTAHRRSFPSRLDLPVGQEAASFAIPTMAGGAWHEEQFEIPTRRRGVVPIGPARSVQGDPFGLSGRPTDWTQIIELFVHPRTVNLPGRQTGFIHDLEGHASSHLTVSDMSFHALREYVPGDDRRHIHWRSSARTGQLMVRQFEETRQSRVALALDTAAGSYLDEDEFELAVSVIGSVAVQCIREENPLALMTTVDVLPAVSPMRALDELCRVDTHPRGSIFDLVTAVTQREPAASIVILATGSTAGIDRVRRAVANFDVDTRVVAVVVDPSTSLSVRTVSNVTMVRVPSLAELARAMRQAMR
ncbi:DUF58 domain-containing protein [Propionibacteriaceae bacterium Y1923]|uniref:DUF58 domain-containing protein n=1 Tax=Aestuariimicrobium sp. Y1814 TaxID=3418742 RepID=UPI003C1C44EB